jgi:PleD family two-component response regulator
MNKAKVLIVADDSNMSSLIRTFLSRVERFDVRNLNSFSSTLATAREYRPDVIILDVDVSETDCGEVTAQLRSDESLSKVPLILLSRLIGNDEAASRNEIVFISKSVLLGVLFARFQTPVYNPSVAEFACV